MKKTLAIMLALIMALCVLPAVAFAEAHVAWIGETGYETLGEAVKAAKSGDTIMLGEGNYSLYDVCGHSGASGKSTDYTAGKDLTFIGKGTDKTFWGIGATMPDPANFGTEYNSDYSFDVRSTVDKKETIKFQNMTLQSGEVDYLGFSGTDNTIIEDCIIKGKTFFWGYTSATFTNTTFNCPAGDYAVWTYSSPTMTFENCTFNSSGKVINVYTDYSAGKYDITVTFNNCTVNNTGTSLKPVLNINDSNMGDFKYILNITGDNKVTGVDVDNITCSRLFGFGGKADNNKAKTVVTINNVKVWENGSRACAHNGVVFGEGSYNGDKAIQYTDGYKDNAFTIKPNTNGSGFLKVCNYCGYSEPYYGELYNEIGLKRTVRQNESTTTVETITPKDTYKVNGSSGITVDYTATMNMENLEWRIGNVEYNKDNKYTYSDKKVTPWELLTAIKDRISTDTTVILTFNFDNKIDLAGFKGKYEAAANKTDVLKLDSTMFEIGENGVVFDSGNNKMTITCKWKKEATTNKSSITLYGYGLPVTGNWGGSTKIDIHNGGCVSGTVHIGINGAAGEIIPDVAKVQQLEVSTESAIYNIAAEVPGVTIQIPIVGGCATDDFTLYYSNSGGHDHYYPTPTPVPVAVIMPKTGDMTIWQSILNLFGLI